MSPPRTISPIQHRTSHSVQSGFGSVGSYIQLIITATLVFLAAGVIMLTIWPQGHQEMYRGIKQENSKACF